MPIQTLAQALAAAEVALRQATARRDDSVRQAETILDSATRAGRSTLTADDQQRVDDLISEAKIARSEVIAAEAKVSNLRAITAEEDDVSRKLRQTYPIGGAVTSARSEEHAMPAGRLNGPGSTGHRAAAADGDPRRFVRSDGRDAAVARGQSLVDHEVVQEAAASRATADQAVIGQHGSLGNLVRSMSTTSGSAIVPVAWAADVIDRARNRAAVLQAGAQIVPMDAKIVNIGRLTADPSAAFRTEGSLITASDPVFDNVQLSAKTLSALVVGSQEFFQDADNADEVITNAIGAAIGQTIDLAALYGGITTGGEGINLPTPPNPRGILASLLADAPSSVLGGGANGTAQSPAAYYAELLDLIYTPRYFNEEPNALLWNAKLGRAYAGAADTTNQPMRAPSDVESIAKFMTNALPSFSQGTMVNKATDAFVGDFTQLIIGQRLDVTIEVLTERYSELGQVGVKASWRGDVGLARARAFAAFRYIQGA